MFSGRGVIGPCQDAGVLETSQRRGHRSGVISKRLLDCGAYVVILHVTLYVYSRRRLNNMPRSLRADDIRFQLKQQLKNQSSVCVTAKRQERMSLNIGIFSYDFVGPV